MPRPIANPPNPWSSQHVEYLGEPPAAALEVYEERARSLLVHNESPDLALRWSANPYRGCYHACAYCYARRSHQYLGLGAGTDFERRIVVKVNAVERLRAELGRPSWQREPILLSGNTDPYQPLEACYRLTRGCLEMCLERENPVGVITKGSLVRRDADVLARLARKGLARVYISIPFADDALARLIEPSASKPSQRLETLRLLRDAGIPLGVSLAPVIPGLNDSDMPEILARAREAGAERAFMTLVRLTSEVAAVFTERLEEALPLRAKKVLAAIRELRGGRLNDSRFGHRMRGEGPRWEMIHRMFELHTQRLGYEPADGADVEPPPQRQPSLFG
ncbi:MAG: PA0069 family radical SAM protein [Acidobacteriota bacterium]|nr:MAG: PA0069 family radical SAM protein [Acidobacteriota bacterium]